MVSDCYVKVKVECDVRRCEYGLTIFSSKCDVKIVYRRNACNAEKLLLASGGNVMSSRGMI